MEEFSLLTVLSFGNLILSAANLILTFSLVVYILTNNLWSSVARSFAGLMIFVAIVYASDVVLSRGIGAGWTTVWLKVQWLGIALVPATYLHFSDALLRTTNASSRRRRIGVFASYAIGVSFVFLAGQTEYVVRNTVHYEPWAPQLEAGQFFWLFALYFFLASAWGFANTLWARSRALTPTSRRRMSYLVASFAAPGLAVYPYLIFVSLPDLFSPAILLALLLAGNLGVALMTVVMAYSVAYQGALSPDRVVKRSFLTYLLRGPALGLFVLLIILIVPRVEIILGAPRETMLIFAIVGGIIFYQLLLRFLRPFVDFAAYRNDREELEILHSLDRRLLTSSDMRQLLQNILTAVCDLLRTRNGVVVGVTNGRMETEAICGEKEKTAPLLETLSPVELARLNGEAHQPDCIESWISYNGFALLPLKADELEGTLGFLAIEPGEEIQPLTERESALMRQYVRQAEIALQDRRLQQGIFTLLQQLTPQMETLQRWRSSTPFPQSGLDTLEDATNPIYDENFTQLVRDALGHYWGGRRLTESPLLALNVVRAKLEAHDNNPARALRAVLAEALDAIKPEGEREMTTQEWLLYNILDLKYIQGRRARDVAMHLAMSESDLYRKQRAAIEELAKTISKMEKELGGSARPD